jgi:hypothetical protein
MATSSKNRRPSRKSTTERPAGAVFAFNVSDIEGNRAKFYTSKEVSKWGDGRVGVSIRVDQERRA